MSRWTVRNVDLDEILAIQKIAIETGVGLGEALSTAIRHGAAMALRELKDKNSGFNPVEALERVEAIQASSAKTLQILRSILANQIYRD